MVISSRLRAAFASACAATMLAGGAVAVPAAAVAPSIGFASAHFNRNGYNWSGHARHGGSFTSVVANWTEPHVRCNSNNNLMAPWVGIDGYGSKTVEQTGVATWCNRGKSHDEAWYEMYPKAPVYYDNPVSAGDRFTALVTRHKHTYTLSIKNLTKHWTEVVAKTLKGANNASAEAIIESPTGSYPNFGHITFTGVKINGRNLGSFHPTALDASNKHGYEDRTSKISNGTTFTITFKHA